jgi:hypothetical protein
MALLNYFLLREGCPSANVCVPLISARVPYYLSTAETASVSQRGILSD